MKSARAFRYAKPKKVNANMQTPLEMEGCLNVAEQLGYLPMFLPALTAGLDHIRFTDLRHTCAVLSLRNGMDAKELTDAGARPNQRDAIKLYAVSAPHISKERGHPKAFAESALTIPPALKGESWPLLDYDLKTVVRHNPTMPLTILQNR